MATPALSDHGFRRSRHLLLLSTLLATACSSLPQLTEPVGSFAAATQSVVAAERNYLQTLRWADETAQRNEATLAYVLDPTHPKLVPPTRQTLTGPQLAAYQALLDSLQIYADQLQTLAGGDNSALDEATQKLALQALSTDQAIVKSGIPPEQAGKVATALAAIADALTDARRTEAIQTTAARLDPSIKQLVEVLKGNNAAAAVRIDADRRQTRQSLSLLLQSAGSSPNASSAELALFYRQIDSDARLLDAGAAGATSINAALDAWRDAHHSMATTPAAQWSTLLPAARHRVEAAVAYYASLQQP